MENQTDLIIKEYLRLDKAVNEKFNISYGKRSLTIPQLLVLSELDEKGPIQISALAESIGNANSTVSGIVDRLESVGLVKRSRFQGDRRVVIVEATERFRQVKEELGGSVSAYFEGVLCNCDKEEKTEILNGLELMSAKLEALEPPDDDGDMFP